MNEAELIAKLKKQESAMLNVMDDIELEKKKVEDLAADLEKFKLAVANAAEHMVITDPDGIILYMNHAAENITGYSIGESLGKKAGSKDLWGGLMPLEFYVTMWDTLKKQKKVFAGEIKNRRKSGELYDAYAMVAPIIKNGAVSFFIGIERDITAEKNIDRVKTEFVSLASHQLRTPIGTANWYTEMLLNGDAGVLSDAQREMLEEVHAENKLMMELVESLLNVSRMDLGTFVVESKPTNMTELWQSVVKEQAQTLTQKKQNLEQQIASDIPAISVDPKLWRMVFQNLLSNAIKYTPESGAIKVSMEIGKAKTSFNEVVLEQDSLCFAISDTGYGIPKEQQDKIFGKLFRANNVKEKDIEGTGLGLYIVKSVIETSGGSISFVSVINQGTSFYIILPLVAKK
ncbi:MAG: ATP-binding protein [Candidatus Falkowbacteria bacterium]